MVEKGEDLHAISLSNGWQYALSLHSLELHLRWNDQQQDPRKVLLFSDRPVYRPGETLFLKAIARDWQEHQWNMPPEFATKLECFDARDRKFFETNLIFSTLGSADAVVSLP